jgi:hypothetical protein
VQGLLKLLTLVNICVNCIYLMKARSREESVATMEKANRAAEQLAKTTGDSYRAVIDHVVALQERNVRFAQGLVDGSIKELRYQAESNRAMSQELLERAERQREAFQRLLEESVEAYMELAYAPFSYYKEGLEAAKKAAR